MDFDILEIRPVDYAPNKTIPAYFLAAQDDSLVPVSHSIDIYNIYKGPKEFMLVEGHHNSIRSDLISNKIGLWFA
jgi:fermentation-respiration switch protein FrsA (DUF1100 family)